jgi:hypothetical protein
MRLTIIFYIVGAIASVLRQYNITTRIDRVGMVWYSDMTLVATIILGFGCGGFYLLRQSQIPVALHKMQTMIVKEWISRLIWGNLICGFTICLLLMVFSHFIKMSFGVIIIGCFLGISQMAFNISILFSRCAGNLRYMSEQVSLKLLSTLVLTFIVLQFNSTVQLVVVCEIFINTIFVWFILRKQYGPNDSFSGVVSHLSIQDSSQGDLGLIPGYFLQTIFGNLFLHWDRGAAHAVLDINSYPEYGLLITFMSFGLNVQPLISSLLMKKYAGPMANNDPEAAKKLSMKYFFGSCMIGLVIAIAAFIPITNLINKCWPLMKITGHEILPIAISLVLRLSDSFTLLIFMRNEVVRVTSFQFIAILGALFFMLVANIILNIKFTTAVLCWANCLGVFIYTVLGIVFVKFKKSKVK